MLHLIAIRAAVHHRAFREIWEHGLNNEKNVVFIHGNARSLITYAIKGLKKDLCREPYGRGPGCYEFVVVAIGI